MKIATPVLLSALLLSDLALAEEPGPRHWSLDASAAYVVIGGSPSTGGIMPAVTFRRTWAPTESVTLGAGVGLGVFGLGGDSRWIGVLGGPVVSASWRPWTPPLSLTASFAADFGRVPRCNAWGWCMRWIGFFPAPSAGLSYDSGRLGASAAVAVRVISTWEGATVSVEPALAGRVSW